jgi:hypothetical protein
MNLLRRFTDELAAPNLRRQPGDEGPALPSQGDHKPNGGLTPPRSQGRE